MNGSPNAMMPDSLKTFTGGVFHYTSSTGLLGSLRSGSVWASAASSLNDLGEVRQGWALIQKLFAAEPSSPVVDMLKRLADDPLKREHEVFVLSASTDGDDANQWRLYADEGRGYAVELDASVALAAVSEVPDPSPAKGTRIGTLARNIAAVSPWHKVLYQESEVDTAIQELIAAATAEDASIASTAGMPQEARDAAYDALQDDVYEALATIAHLIKSSGFAGENEVRVVATLVWGEEHIRYRAAANGIVGYATLAAAPGGPRRTVLRPAATGLSVVTTLPIKSVRLGPLLRPEHENTMKAFLRSLHLKGVTIKASTVPLR